MKKFTHLFIFSLLTLLFLSTGQVWGGTTNKDYTPTYNSTDKKWYSLDAWSDGNWKKSPDETFSNLFQPHTGSMTFKWKTEYYAAGVYADVYCWSDQIDVQHYTGQTSETSATVDIKTNATSATFYYNTRGLGNKKYAYVKNVKLPVSKHIWVQTSDGTNKKGEMTKTFGNVRWGESKEITVNFRSFLTAGNITITIEGDTNGDWSFSSSEHGVHSLTTSANNKNYAVGANMCACDKGAAGAACATGVLGKASEYDFKVYFFPKKANVGTSYTGNNVYVLITDETSSAKIYLRGTCIKRGQFISWNTANSTIKTTDNIVFDAVAKDSSNTSANSGVSITYAPTSGSPAYMSGNALQIITSTATNTPVVITASAAADTYYNAASNVTKNITIEKVTPTVTWPTIADNLVYTPGEKVKDHWSGGSAVDDKNNSVAGSFSCDEELQPAKNSTGYTVTFTPDNTNWYNPVQTTLTKNVAKADQYITWDLQDGQNAKGQYYEYAEGEAFGATSYRLNTTTATNLTVTYESSDNSIATVDGNSLRVHTVGQVVTITAKQTGNDNWNAATQVSKTFKTCGVKPNTFNVSATNLTYGQFLSASTLTGTVSVNSGSAIPGTLTWVEPETFPSAGANQTFDVLFTPEKTDVFGSVIFPVTINVAKADPAFNWNIGNTLRAESHYSNFVYTNNTEANFTITTSSNSLLSVTGTKLTTGSVSGATNGWIRVSLPETDNFNALTTQQLNVTVNPKSNVCLPITTMNAEMYDRTFVSGTDDAKWSEEGLLGIGVKYYVLYTIFYTRRTGIQLGDWNEGLTGADFDAEKYSNKSVVLTFNGSPKDISFDVETQYVYVTKSSGLGFGLTFPYPATYTNWYLYESPDGVNFTQVGDKFNSSSTEAETSTHISRSLKADTRYIKILYSGNFAGWVKNLQITKRAASLTADKNSLTFGTNDHPLQEPQAVTISYGALGTCGQTGAITASIEGEGSSAFYLDETNITDNVGFDYNGTYTVRVRCNDVGKSATLRFRAFDGAEKTVSLTSTTPELISAGSTIFQTGTEHVAVPGSAYRTNTTINYTQCFNGSEAIFDTLYLYGVSESSAANRLWEYDAVKEYNVPALNVAAGNVYTPCFVYKKNNNKYEYARTCDATKLLNISAPGKKLGFIGYRPANMATAANAIQLNGAAGERTDVYFNNTEIVANGVVLKANSSSDSAPFEVVLHARSTNTLSANAAVVQLSAKAQLTIEDSWKSDAASGILALKPAANYPSIDLGGANTVIVNGSQLELHNATNMAIAHMSGATELTDGAVRINDGTITGEAILGMPQNTLIDGGTFNEGNVVCYNDRGKTVRPLNSRKEIVSRQTMTMSELEANYAWYGRAHLTLVGANVHPMLFGGEGICIFNAYEDVKSDKDINWTTTPAATSDAVVVADMEVTDTLTVNSLSIQNGVTVTVPSGATLIIGDGDSYYSNAGNLHVENDGKVILNNGILTVNDFILDATLNGLTDAENPLSNQSAKSGQVTNAANIDKQGNAYFDLSFDPSGKISFGWYDFTVPFAVNVNGGIFRVGTTNDCQAVSGVHFLIMEADEADRAKGGRGWRNLSTAALQPGKLYTITFDYQENFDQNTFRFMWNGEGTMANGTSYSAQCASGSNPDLKGWNGLGNGMLRHGYPTQNYKRQAYNHSTNTYDLVTGDKTFAVGSAFFIQVDEAGDVNWTAAEATNSRPLYAPAYEAREVDEFMLNLYPEDADNAIDALYCSASEEATSAYVIGHDLVKMGAPKDSKVARMWATKGGKNLCDVEAALVNDNASAPLTFYAPQTGVYRLALGQTLSDATLYLTQDGNVIWNLSMYPYELELSKGLNEGYGLRIVAERKTATGVDNTESDDAIMRKVIIDNTLYIITPEGKMYDVTGKNIK